jgi:hypothetical protein
MPIDPVSSTLIGAVAPDVAKETYKSGKEVAKIWNELADEMIAETRKANAAGKVVMVPCGVGLLAGMAALGVVATVAAGAVDGVKRFFSS